MQALGYNCGQNISFNWYIHLIQKVSDAPEFCLFVKRNLTFFLNCIVFVRNVKLSSNFVFYVYWK
jgi:hypothetical protein